MPTLIQTYPKRPPKKSLIGFHLSILSIKKVIKNKYFIQKFTKTIAIIHEMGSPGAINTFIVAETPAIITDVA